METRSEIGAVTEVKTTTANSVFIKLRLDTKHSTLNH